MALRAGFLMDMIAGHVTNYRNLRSVVDQDPELEASWHEIHYYKPGGVIERLRERLPVLPSYASGILRGTVEMHHALRERRHQVLFSNSSVGVFFWRVFRRIPTLIDFDSTPVQMDKMPAYTPKPDPAPVARLKWWVSWKMMHAASVLQAWSRWAARSAVADYGIPEHKVVVNPPGVDLDLWRPDPSRRRPPGELPRRVLFVGGDFRRKGGQLLLDWYRTQRPDRVELHIVTRERVPSAPGVFVYHDVQPNSPELIGLYQQSDLFVLPSLAECFGIATIEAMGTGLPVIASEVGGTADIIDSGNNGFIVPGDDVAALTQAIATVLEDPERRRNMGLASRALAEERFDLVTNARRCISFMKGMAQRAANGAAAGERRQSA